MFGTDKKPKRLFQFDLEVELEKDHKKCEDLIAKTEKEKHALKSQLRSGMDKTDFENGGVILQAFDALETVLKRISKKK
jgi:hypothetical protein